MRLYNDVIQESQLVHGDHTEHLNNNSGCQKVLVIDSLELMLSTLGRLLFTPIGPCWEVYLVDLLELMLSLFCRLL